MSSLPCFEVNYVMWFPCLLSIIYLWKNLVLCSPSLSHWTRYLFLQRISSQFWLSSGWEEISLSYWERYFNQPWRMIYYWISSIFVSICCWDLKIFPPICSNIWAIVWGFWENCWKRYINEQCITSVSSHHLWIFFWNSIWEIRNFSNKKVILGGTLWTYKLR